MMLKVSKFFRLFDILMTSGDGCALGLHHSSAEEYTYTHRKIIYIYITTDHEDCLLRKTVVSCLSFSSVLVDSIGTMHISVMRREKRVKPVERGVPCLAGIIPLAQIAGPCALQSWVSLSGRMEKVLRSWLQCRRFSPISGLLSPLIEIQDNRFSIPLFFPLNLESYWLLCSQEHRPML